MAEDRADVDEQRVFAGFQQRQCLSQEFGGGKKVDFHDLAQDVGRAAVEPPVGTDAGVVDEYIKTAPVVANAFGHGGT